MARKKVALWYIHNDSTRLNTLKKRTKNLMKKASEVATLCNAKACMLVYGEGTTMLEVFPSNAEAVAILNRFKSIPEVPQLKKTMDQETILSKRLVQLRHQVEKIRREHKDCEPRILLHKAMVSGHLPGNIEELTTMAWKLEIILKSVGERITKRNGQPPVYQAQAPYVTSGMGMGSPMYQALRQQHEG
ncbi:agamous-like MADS-box protein AGL80 [Triticum dicoccoides]|uniref:agamous-like MADS-box protein AGL80 n=1 Tax=Triticum dicoccoides TaxID=85692 RepID=UPI00189145F6|nr:agamous-like MADS-box protein AGL80 [Triticum dicoccoides]